MTVRDIRKHALPWAFTLALVPAAALALSARGATLSDSTATIKPAGIKKAVDLGATVVTASAG